MLARGIAMARDEKQGIELLRRACRAGDELGCEKLLFFGQGP
jgi:TPR repeat protein